jgi:hypothetical protein
VKANSSGSAPSASAGCARTAARPTPTRTNPRQVCLFFGGLRPLVPLFLPGPPFFRLFFSCPPPCQLLHLLAHAMASDFTTAWQFLQREQLFFCYVIKLHALASVAIICKTRVFTIVINTLTYCNSSVVVQMLLPLDCSRCSRCDKTWPELGRLPTKTFCYIFLKRAILSEALQAPGLGLTRVCTARPEKMLKPTRRLFSEWRKKLSKV